MGSAPGGGDANVTGLRHNLLVRETGPTEGITHRPAEFREAVRYQVKEAHRLRKKAAAHCHGDRAARDAI